MRALAGRLDPQLQLGNRRATLRTELWVYGGDRSCEGGGPPYRPRMRLFSRASTGGPWALGSATSPRRSRRGSSLAYSVRLLATHVRGRRTRALRRRAGDGPATMALVTRSGSHLRSERRAGAPARADREARDESGCHNFLLILEPVLWLCFSASSHVPWVNDGLPRVAPAGDGMYAVGETICDLDDAVRLIESELEAFPGPALLWVRSPPRAASPRRVSRATGKRAPATIGAARCLVHARGEKWRGNSAMQGQRVSRRIPGGTGSTRSEVADD